LDRTEKGEGSLQVDGKRWNVFLNKMERGGTFTQIEHKVIEYFLG